MALVMMLLAGLVTGTGNLFMRRSIDRGGSPHAFLAVQFTFSLVVALLMNPVRLGYYAFDWSSAGLGLSGGILLGVMAWLMGLALQRGPAGFTFATLNSATVMPGILLALIGFPYTTTHAVGSILVIVGLFWAGWGVTNSARGWLPVVLAGFAAHALLLCLLQLRVYWQVDGIWFMPVMYAVSWVVQIVVFVRREHRLPKRREFFLGVLGGIAHGFGSYLMIRAPEYATPMQSAMLFPLFAVTLIVYNNLWAHGLYKERVNWVAYTACLGGLILGTVDWSVIF